MRIIKPFLLLLFLNFVRSTHKNKPVVTFITILINLGGPKRSYQTYLTLFKDVLSMPSNLIVFGQKSLQKFVNQHRSSENTLFIQLTKNNISSRWQSKMIDKAIKKAYPRRMESHQINKCIRFYNTIPYYLPLVMQKIHWMHYAMKKDPFHSDFYSWIDAGITHMLKPDYFSPRSVFQQFRIYNQVPFHMHEYVWTAKGLFDSLLTSEKQLKYVTKSITPRQYILAGYFGGRADAFPTAAHVWQNFLRILLNKGQVGFEQTFFTLMRYRYPILFGSVTHNKVTNYKIQINQPVFLQAQEQRRWSFQQNTNKNQEKIIQFQQKNIRFESTKDTNKNLIDLSSNGIRKIKQTYSSFTSISIKALISKQRQYLKKILFEEAVFMLFLLFFTIVIHFLFKIQKIRIKTTKQNYYSIDNKKVGKKYDFLTKQIKKQYQNSLNQQQNSLKESDQNVVNE